MFHSGKVAASRPEGSASLLRSVLFVGAMAGSLAGVVPGTLRQAHGQQPAAPAPLAGDTGMKAAVQRGEDLVKTAKWHVAEWAGVQDTVLAGGVILAGTNAGNVVAFDTATGQKKWEKASGGGRVSLTYADGDTVLVHAAGATHAVSALSVGDGSEKWALDVPYARTRISVKGPYVWVGLNLSENTLQGGPVAMPDVPPGPPELRAYARDTGKLLWTCPLPVGTMDYVGYRLEQAGDTLYLLTSQRLEGARATALTPSDGKTRWTYSIPRSTPWAALTMADGFVVMELTDPAQQKGRQLIALDAANGAVVRKVDVTNDGSASWALPNGRLIIVRAPKPKSLRSGDVSMLQTLTLDDVKAKYTVLDLKTGGTVWNAEVFLDEKKYDTTVMDIQHIVHVDKDLVLVSLRGVTNYYAGATKHEQAWDLTALDLATGKTRWSNTMEEFQSGNPRSVLCYKDLIIFCEDVGMTAVSRTDGRRVWCIPGNMVTMGISPEGMLYFRTYKPQSPSEIHATGSAEGVYAIPLEGNPAATPPAK